MTDFVWKAIDTLDREDREEISDSTIERFVAELQADELTIGFLKHVALFWIPNVEWMDAAFTRFHHLAFKYIGLVGPRVMQSFAPQNRLRSLEIARSLTFCEMMHHLSQLRCTEQVQGDLRVFRSALERLKMCDKSNVAYLNGQQIFRMEREKWIATFGLTQLQARVVSNWLYMVLQSNSRSQEWHVKLFTDVNANTADVVQVQQFVKCDVYDADGVGNADDAAFLRTLTEAARSAIVAQRLRKQQQFRSRFEANLQKRTLSASAAKKATEAAKKAMAVQGKRRYHRYDQQAAPTGAAEFGINDNIDAGSSGRKGKHSQGAPKDSAKRAAAKQCAQRSGKKAKPNPKPKQPMRLNTDEVLLKEQLRHVVETFANTDTVTLSTLSSALAALQHESVRICTMQKKLLREEEQVAKPTATCPDCSQKLSSFSKMFMHQTYECEFECKFNSCNKAVTEEHEKTCIIGQRLHSA